MAARSNPAKLLKIGASLVSMDGVGSFQPYLGFKFPGATVTDRGAGVVEVDFSGAGGTPGGNDTELQFNNAGAFDGTANFTYVSGGIKANASGFLSFGTTPATAGTIRLSEAFTVLARDSGNTDNMHILDLPTGSEVLHIGTSATFAAGDQVSQIKAYASGSVEVGGGGTTAATFSATGTVFANPISVGATVASAGLIRIPYNQGDVLVQRDNVNASDWVIIDSTVSALQFGNADQTTTLYGYSVAITAGTSAVDIAVSGAYGFQVTSTTLDVGQPLIGDSRGNSPYGVHGKVAVPMANANVTLTAAQYKYGVLEMTGANTTDRTATLPDASSAARSYVKAVINATTGGFNVIFADATGHAPTVTVGPNKSAFILVDETGVRRLTADV